jgi:hypothetical protein
MTLNNIPLAERTEAEVQQAIRAMLPEYCGKCTGWNQKLGSAGYCGVTGKRTSKDYRCDVPAIPIAEQRAG